MKKPFTLALCLATTFVFAQTEILESVVSPDYVVQGDTIFVRPKSSRYEWTSQLSSRLNNYYKPSKIKTVVFVNMGNVGRWEKVGSEVLVQKWLKAANATTIAVGACENYCASWFAGGTKRLLAKGAYIDLKTPIDLDTQKLEPRYPHTQFAMFERDTASPAVIPHKEIFVEAFTKGGMTGGTRFSVDHIEFCKARNPDVDCKVYEGLDAYKVGLLTDPNPVEILLPEGW
jgi:hypothetical protein